MNEKLEKAWRLLLEAMEILKEIKPEERSAKARYFAVVITELEKVIAYFKVFIIGA